MPLSRLTPETAFHFPANNKIQGAAFGRAETPSILQICLFSDAAVDWSRNYAADENLLEYIGFFYLIGSSWVQPVVDCAMSDERPWEKREDIVP